MTARRIRQSRTPATAPEVHKLGGASLADAPAVQRAVELVRALPGTPVVVVSALARVTDALIAATNRAAAGEQDGAAEIAQDLRRRYLAIARTVLRRQRRPLEQSITREFDELDGLLGNICAVREAAPRTRDYVLARGERLAGRLMAAALADAGRRAVYVDAMEVVRTDGPFGNAAPNLAKTDRLARDKLLPLLRRRVIPVVPGFFGAGPGGELTTLGRGGADLTATMLGRALRSRAITLWKDVAGILTADPRSVPEARVIPELHVREGAELAYYGAKVLHPRALIPLKGRRSAAIRVRPFAHPAAPGTEVSRRAATEFPVKAVSTVNGQALITVAGNGMLGVPGIAARAFGAVHREGVSISMITQASSEHSISFTLPGEHARATRASLLREFAREVTAGEIDGVEVRSDVSTMAVVGLGIAGAPGVSARVFSALAEAGIDVVATAHGSSDLNLSVVIAARDATRAQRAVHGAFQLDKLGGGSVHRRRGIDVVLLGYGQVGRALAPMLAELRRDAGVRVVAVIDRSGFVFDPAGLPRSRLAALGRAKQRGGALRSLPGGRAGGAVEAVRFLGGHALFDPVLVDVTAGDTVNVLETALKSGFNLVLANKRPLTESRRTWDLLQANARENGRRLLHEATVGAGLPIIDTYRKLVESGDRVLRIEGCPSGTLGFLFGEMGRGRAFSEALRDAIDRGYTEPDPRDDLSGMDVARKGLILGRLLGYRGELDQVDVESLVPPAARKLSVREFLARLESFDEAWSRRIAAAARRGRVLRYRAVASRRSVAVGLKLVALTSPTAALHGTDNQFSFTTTRYRTNPLIITGPGAGPAVTAGGILNDILKLARP